jgi:hypothetical protein
MGIIRENLTFTLMQNKTLLRPALVTLGLLLLPLLGNRFVEGCDWSPFDFLLMGALIFVTVLAFELIARKAKTTAYRAALGLALLASFLLLWINLAVGLIGSEDNPANLLYLAVLAIGFLGSLFARLQPRGMARTLFAMALAQMLVPTMAYIYWRPDFSPGVIAVFGLNAVFATLFIGSGLLFRQAGATQAKQS